MRLIRLKIVLPLLLGVLLLFFPLLRDFHFESAFVAALIGGFWTGIELTRSNSKNDLTRTFQLTAFVLLIGLAPLLFSIFSGCFSWQGLGFWLFLPIPSVLFGAAIGRVVRLYKVSKPSLISFLLIIWVSTGAWLIEFFTLPQVYFFNHVWGAWPGPIYDETLSISFSLLFFRFITFLWVLILWILPNVKKNTLNRIGFSLMLILIGVCYTNLSSFHVITPRTVLKQELPQHISTEHFDLYFDNNNFTKKEANYWAEKHEFYFHQIITKLEIDWPPEQKIESFLYANAWQKKRLVGAKFTSYVPIWLAQDQLHIAKQHLDGVLEHELVHVFSKQFGNSLFNGSYSIGVIEGLAEAIAQDASSESTLHQIIAAEQPYPSAREMETDLSLAGFYSSASSISYTTAGSFMQYLLNYYPIQNFKEAYANADFEKAYNQPFSKLVEEWHQHLSEIEIDSVDRNISEFIFSRRSLFQKACPHKMNPEFKLWDDYNYALSNDDSLAALYTIDKLYEIEPSNNLVKREWVSQQLFNANYEVHGAIAESDSLITLQLLKADALFLSNSFVEASRLLQTIKPKIDASSARNFKYSYQLRSDSLNWHHFLSSRYNNTLPSLDQFEQLETSTQMLLLAKSLENDSLTLFLPVLNSVLTEHKLSSDWFDIYYQLLDELIYLRQNEMADIFIQRLQKVPLRARYSQRLLTLIAWNEFSRGKQPYFYTK